MKPVAIHDNNLGFSVRWIEYCTLNSIPFVRVDCYSNNIIEILKGCSALMWHWNYENYKDYLFAKQLLITLGAINIKVFPEFWTTFLFDDKLGQKYLFETLDIPTPKTMIFYDKQSALEWGESAVYPIIFKLRTGAGSQNVKLVKSFSKARTIILKIFNRGYKSKNSISIFKDKFARLKSERSLASLFSLFKTLFRWLVPTYDEKTVGRQKGYVIFQEYLPDNKFDTRLIILGDRCFGIIRNNRKNDFRASGSGRLDYDPDKIDINAIKLSFEIASKLNVSLLALDFLRDKNFNPLVTEISFGFAVEAYDFCPGYWDSNLGWHSGRQNLQYLMVKDLIEEINK